MNNCWRNDIVEINSQEDELQFQIIDAYGEDIDKGMLNDRFQNLSYQINLFGITKEGKSVYCKVVNFKPYFFVKCPQNWSEYDVYRSKYAVSRMSPQSLTCLLKVARLGSRFNGILKTFRSDGRSK